VTNKIIPVILAGGSGTRLWPLSRSEYPKQFLSLNSDYSMIQETLIRLKGLDTLSSPLVICNEKHRFIVAEQMQQIDINDVTILLEPESRNTAPAIGSAAITLAKNGDNDSILLVLPADHVIQNVESFHNAVNLASSLAKNGQLVTFGIVPTTPDSNYGYIKTNNSNQYYFDVEEFTEKPSEKTAEKYLEEGNYLWNSGMFMFQANTLINELEKHSPETCMNLRKSVQNSQQDLDFIRLEKEFFNLASNNSIDYELMEKSDNVVVVPLDAGWNDIGSWNSLYDIGQKDNNGNFITGDVITEDTTNCFIHSEQQMIATIGLNEICVVNTPDVTLISNKKDINKVKKVINQLQKLGRGEQIEHRKVYRPWGWFDSIASGDNFQVKKLHITPNAKLSLQLHKYRAEHWVVVNGIATVTSEDKTITLSVGQSIYIPINTKHSIANLSNEVLDIIEVQSGSYLGEDDIERFEDIYGREVQ
jgi:mannose-1-phosphate guanylyltransferase/mannose-6-phosphate isomerase